MAAPERPNDLDIRPRGEPRVRLGPRAERRDVSAIRRAQKHPVRVARAYDDTGAKAGTFEPYRLAHGCDVYPRATRIERGDPHVDLDVEHHLDLARELNISRTPTVLVLDADGAIVTFLGVVREDGLQFGGYLLTRAAAPRSTVSRCRGGRR